MKKIIVILILAFLINQAGADQGRAGAQFLKIFPGVFGPSLGGASSTLNNSSEVVFWNPAGLNDINKTSFFMSHAEYFAGIKYENIAFTLPLSYGVLSFHGTGLLSGNIRETTLEEPDGTGDFFHANNYAFGVAYGMKMTNKFSMGVSAKVLFLSVDKVSAKGFAFDAGAKYKSGLPGNLIFAFTIKNFGPNINYNGEGLQDLTRKTENEFEEEDVKFEYIAEDFPLPLSFSFAISGEIPISENQNIGIALENWQVLDLKEIYRLGVTWNYGDLFYVSGGNANLIRMFNPNISDRDVNGSMKSWCIGAGVNLGMIFNKSFWVKYAWEEHEYFNGINRIGIDVGI